MNNVSNLEQAMIDLLAVVEKENKAIVAAGDRVGFFVVGNIQKDFPGNLGLTKRDVRMVNLRSKRKDVGDEIFEALQKVSAAVDKLRMKDEILMFSKAYPEPYDWIKKGLIRVL